MRKPDAVPGEHGQLHDFRKEIEKFRLREKGDLVIDLEGRLVEKVGWAGPLLWVHAGGGVALHLYDASIELDGVETEAGDGRVEGFVGRRLVGVVAKADGLSVVFDPRSVLEVRRSDDETARIFVRGDLRSHWIYRNGKLLKDPD